MIEYSRKGLEKRFGKGCVGVMGARQSYSIVDNTIQQLHEIQNNLCIIGGSAVKQDFGYILIEV